MKTISKIATLVVSIVVFILGGCAAVGSSMNKIGERLGSSESSAQEQKTKKLAEMPSCQRSLGTIAVVEPEHNWWQQIQIQSPEALIKIYIQKSKCFTIVDRGRGFALAQKERELSGSGELKKKPT